MICILIGIKWVLDVLFWVKPDPPIESVPYVGQYPVGYATRYMILTCYMFRMDFLGMVLKLNHSTWEWVLSLNSVSDIWKWKWYPRKKKAPDPLVEKSPQGNF